MDGYRCGTAAAARIVGPAGAELIAARTIDEHLVLLIKQKAQLFEDYAQQSAVKSASAMAVDGGGLVAPVAAELQRMIEEEAKG